MQPIKAFVAHSFTDDDKRVVEVILEYLDTVSKIHPRFTWEHAESPEPVVIDAKVLSRLIDKNLLIAICTRKERAIQTSALSKRFYLPKSLFVGEERDFEWKTSDWIIQEIGLAIGRSMKIILLVEEGTRPPGTLQGNLERIDFNRTAPEQCFDKLLGMIAALSPHADGGQATAATDAGPQTADNIEAQRPTDSNSVDWVTPKPDWKKRDFEFAYRYFTAVEKEADAQRISDQYLLSAEGEGDSNRKEWDSFREYLRIVWDRGGDLAKVQQLSTMSPTSSRIASLLARCYSHYAQHEKAATTFQLAANAAGDIREKISFLGDAALSYQKAGLQSKALDLDNQVKKICDTAGDGEIQVLEFVQRLAEERKEGEIEVAALERLLELKPADEDKRFSLAYKYSNMGRDDLAVYHYSRIPAANRTAMTWNNLGVSLSSIELPIKSIAAYRKAQEQGETLAMSNLAHKFLDSGFLREAEEMVDNALRIADHHKNVDKALGTIQTTQEAESRKETESLEKSKPISIYYGQFGRSLVKPPSTNILGRWQSPKCVLVISLNGATFVATGSYERSAGLGLVALAMFSSAGIGRNDPPPVQYVEEFRGEVRGRTIVGSVSRKREGDKPGASTILTSEDDPKVLMWIADTDDKIHVLERKASSEPQFYTLERL